MLKKFAAAVALVALLSVGAAAQNVKTVISDAYEAMGAEHLDSIKYSGSAWYLRYGSAPTAEGPWTGSKIADYTRAIDLNSPALRDTGSMISPTGFGGPPELVGYSHTAKPGDTSWTDGADHQWPYQFEIWITPWGFLKAAAANNATVHSESKAGMRYAVVSFKTPQKSPSGLPYTFNGYINDQNMVERVETWLDHPIFGDIHVDATYLGYQNFGGPQVPTHIVMRNTGGATTFEAWITSAIANPENIAELLKTPKPRASRQERALVLKSEKLADGVYRISGGPGVYVALAVEMKDYIIVHEAGQSVALGSAIIAEAKRAIPNKPIRYVFNSHPHYDHSSGLAPFVAEGATIITAENNRAFFERALSGPRTLVGDALAKAPKKPKFETVTDVKVIGDETRKVEYYHVNNLDHTDGMTVAYLPKEKILFTGDFPLPGFRWPGEPTLSFVYTLVENVIDRYKLDFEQFVDVHSANPYVPWTRADVMKAVGRAR
jgi:glyoxylase-like metal-dependent hydrolase (beta-lactamase superfamily II)